MAYNQNLSEKLETNLHFSPKLLNVIWYVGLIGSVLLILPYVFSVDNDFPVETLSAFGEKLTVLAEIIFISMMAYKIYKDGIVKPSYMLLVGYAGMQILDLLVNLISEEIGFITSMISLFINVVVGIAFLMSPLTKKIGFWLLLSMAGAILLLAILSEGFENNNKWVGIGLSAIYCYPYIKYLEGCQKFLTGEVNEKISTT